MTSACATLTSNVPAHSEAFLKPVVSPQVVHSKMKSIGCKVVSCPGGPEIYFLCMKPLKRHLKLTTNG